MSAIRTLIAIAFLVAALSAACSQGDKARDALANPNLARVAAIDIRLVESNPNEIEVWATGRLPDNCARVGDVTQTRAGNTITLTLTNVRVEKEGCAQELNVEFVQIVPLNAEGLEAGVYNVVVNGVSSAWTVAARGQ